MVIVAKVEQRKVYETRPSLWNRANRSEYACAARVQRASLRIKYTPRAESTAAVFFGRFGAENLLLEIALRE